MLDKFRGCILGGAMGDSLGYPVEFYNVSFIKNHKLLKEPYNISLFSDDTQMTLFTAEGIIESNGNVLDYIYSAYKYWWATQMRSMPAGHKFVYESKLYKDSRLHDLRAPGNTCLSALAVPFEKVGNNSCGCGGVMRVAPIGLVYDPERAYEIGCEAARFSHLNPLGYEPAGVFSAIISYIINGEDLKSAIKKAIKLTGNTDLKVMLKKAIKLANDDLDDLYVFEENQWAGWTGHEALAIAIYCALKYDQENKDKKEKFKDALIASVNHNGDSDSTGAILGNILGAYYGVENLPFDKEKLECYDILEDISLKLYQEIE